MLASVFGMLAALSKVLVVGLVGVYIVMFCSGLAYLGFRAFFRILVYWDGLRRRRLVWQLTNAHIVTVVSIAVVFITGLVLYSQFAGRIIRPETDNAGPLAVVAVRIITTVMPIVSALTVVALFVAFIVLPPSAAFSYVFAKRMTKRLEMLATATSALHSGDYSVRINVGGQDELAQLQNDFNAMAAALEKAVADLNAEKAKSESLLQSRRQLVASVSHELRTPVATLRGYLESQLNQPQGLAIETIKHDLEIMEHETIRLQSLIDDLFTLARVEVGGLSLECKSVDIGPVVRALAASCAPLAWQSGKVEVVGEAANGLVARVDEGRFEQVIGNLLRNALRHTPPGGIVVVTASGQDGKVMVQVRDTGEGITPESLPHIWDRFYQGDSTVEAGGAGLGLALVKELTEAMGGSVSVESVPGSGSCFTIVLTSA
jgi:signal transduction histidine kinase